MPGACDDWSFASVGDSSTIDSASKAESSATSGPAAFAVTAQTLPVFGSIETPPQPKIPPPPFGPGVGTESHSLVACETRSTRISRPFHGCTSQNAAVPR